MNLQHNRTALITGGTGGIGLHSAIGIAKTGARVFITGRDASRGEVARQLIQTASKNMGVTFIQADLSSISAIDRLAETCLSHTRTLDILVNNAGYLGSHFLQSDDGLEMHFAVNALAPWRLTNGLLPALKSASGARVVNVSGGDKPAKIDVDNLQAEKGFKGLMTYTHSKSILEAISILLARELKPDGICVNTVFPGRASTAMTQSLSMKSLPGAMKLMYPFFRLFFREDGGKSATKAAQSTIWAATSPTLDDVTGIYFDTHSTRQALHATAYDAHVHNRILEVMKAMSPPVSLRSVTVMPA